MPRQVRTNRLIAIEKGQVYWRKPRGGLLHPAGGLQDVLDAEGTAEVERLACRYYAGLLRRRYD